MADIGQPDAATDGNEVGHPRTADAAASFAMPVVIPKSLEIPKFPPGGFQVDLAEGQYAMSAGHGGRHA